MNDKKSDKIEKEVSKCINNCLLKKFVYKMEIIYTIIKKFHSLIEELKFEKNDMIKILNYIFSIFKKSIVFFCNAYLNNKNRLKNIFIICIVQSLEKICEFLPENKKLNLKLEIGKFVQTNFSLKKDLTIYYSDEIKKEQNEKEEGMIKKEQNEKEEEEIKKQVEVEVKTKYNNFFALLKEFPSSYNEHETYFK